MTLNSKQNRQKLRKQKSEKLVFKRIVRKCRLIIIRMEQNNDHVRRMHRIQFRSSVKVNFCGIIEHTFSDQAIIK